MTDRATGQLTTNAADYYEQYFVPALFKERTEPLIDFAEITPGNTVLDVGCGTGILTRDAWHRMGRNGAVTGIDRSEGMIGTARRVAPDIDWQVGQAEALPFDDGSFDQVISQFALMFFEDREKGLAEMWRVTRPGGRLTVAVWDKLENTPGYAAMTEIDARLFGEEVARELFTPYSLGDKDALRELFAAAGVADVRFVTHEGMARFASIAAWVDLDVKGWTLGEIIGPEGHKRLLKTAQKELQQFVQADGSVAFSSPSHMITARKL
jgi:ubiquinone/menaquinone biosynthesis C-methylase UbiE